MDPLAGYNTAIDDQLGDVVAVLNGLRFLKPGTATVDEVRPRVARSLRNRLRMLLAAGDLTP